MKTIVKYPYAVGHNLGSFVFRKDISHERAVLRACPSEAAAAAARSGLTANLAFGACSRLVEKQLAAELSSSSSTKCHAHAELYNIDSDCSSLRRTTGGVGLHFGAKMAPENRETLAAARVDDEDTRVCASAMGTSSSSSSDHHVIN